VRLQLPIGGLQRVAPIGGLWQERQRDEYGVAVGAPRRGAETNALPERNRL
jgi:hypothetical protein